MAERRGFLKTLLSASLAILAWPFSKGRAGEETIPERMAKTQTDSTVAQGADSTSATPGDTTAPTEPPGDTVTISLERIKSLGVVGGSAILKIKGRKILLVRDSEATIRAFSPTCTHKQTSVKYNHTKRRIECPAHGSRFDLQGSVLKGPASKPLPTYETELSDGRIILSLGKE